MFDVRLAFLILFIYSCRNGHYLKRAHVLLYEQGARARWKFKYQAVFLITIFQQIANILPHVASESLHSLLRGNLLCRDKFFLHVQFNLHLQMIDVTAGKNIFFRKITPFVIVHLITIEKKLHTFMRFQWWRYRNMPREIREIVQYSTLAGNYSQWFVAVIIWACYLLQ